MRRPRPAFAAGLLALLLQALVWPVQADEGAVRDRATVLLFVAPGAEPLAARLDAELASSGLHVIRAEAPESHTVEELAPRLRVAGAAGLVWVGAGALNVEVWIPEPETGRTVLKESLYADETPALAAVVVVRTVELVRATLLAPAAPAAEPPPKEEGAPSQAQVTTRSAPPPRPRHRVHLVLAPTLLASTGALAALPCLSAVAELRVMRALGLELVAVAPLGTSAIESAAGSSTVWIALVGGGARARFPIGDRWSATGGAGVLAAVVHARGTPHPTYVAASDTMLGVSPYLRAATAVALTSSVNLRADVIGGVVMPRPIIDAAGDDVARWGRPFAALMLGLEGGLP